MSRDRMWNQEGVLVDEGQYKNGAPIGTHRRFHPNGHVLEEVVYLDAKRFNVRVWSDAGVLHLESIWVSDTQYIEKSWDLFQKAWVEKKQEPRIAIPQVRPVPHTHADNRALFMEHFPQLGLLLMAEAPAANDFEGLDEKEEIGKAECIYVYGIGGGAAYFQLQSWLHASPERRLVFLEDRLGALATFIQSAASLEIIQDPQVHFTTEEDIPFPISRIEIFALPSRKGSRFRALKMRLLRKASLSSALHLDRMEAHHPFQHFVKNICVLPSSFYANALKNAFPGMPAIVCGAGPSLTAAIPLLKKLSSRALIIAGGSTLAALSSQGVPIHFGIAVDPNLEEYRRFKNSFAFDTPLLYSTRVNPQIFQTCNGPFGYMRSGIGGLPEIWMEEELGLAGPLIGANLSDEAASVTTICAAWAQFIGCGPIFFSGLDLAYTGQKRYAAGVAGEDDEPLALLDLEKSAADRILRRKDRRGKLILTATRWVMESAALAHFAKKHKKIRFFNTTEGGLPIPGVPYLPLREAGEQYLQSSWDIGSLVREKIAGAAMPAGSAVLATQKIDELKASLQRCAAHLKILSGKEKGSSPLAELELQDEMALKVLFYDTQDVLERDRSSKKPLPAQDKWVRFHRCVEQHLLVL